jgi:hypothetical protein
MSGGRIGDRWRGEEAGSLSLETVAVTPVILLFVVFVIAVGTVQNDRGTMDAAVRAAARSGSLTRDHSAVRGVASAAADAVFTDGGLPECKGTVRLVTNQVGAGLPQPPRRYYNVVRVEGRCSVRIDFGIVTLSEPVSGDFTSVVDTYRGR